MSFVIQSAHLQEHVQFQQLYAQFHHALLGKVLESPRSDEYADYISSSLYFQEEMRDNNMPLINFLECNAYDSMKLVVEQTVSDADNSEYLLSWAAHCDSILRWESTDDSKVTETAWIFGLSTYACTATTAILSALSLGQFKAVEYFPRLLQFIEAYPATREIFVNLVRFC